MKTLLHILYLFGITAAHAGAGADVHAIGAETAEGRKAIRVFVQPVNALVSRDGTEPRARYLSGTPMVVSVRVVNEPVKKVRQNAVPVELPTNWVDLVTMELHPRDELRSVAELNLLHGGRIRPPQTPLTLEGNEAYTLWSLAGEATEALSGEYRIIPRWCGDMNRNVLIDIKRPSTARDNSRITLGRAFEQVQSGRFEAAIPLLQTLIAENGRGFSNGRVYAMTLLGQALEDTADCSGALRCYTEFLDWWRMEHDPQGVTHAIHRLQKKVEERAEQDKSSVRAGARR